MKILCVCLGNICRSPTAEAVLKHMLEGEKAFVDSAGTSAWHQGEAPDGRSTYHASLRGYELKGSSRQVMEEDYEEFDLILAMDQKNLVSLQTGAPVKYKEKVKLLTDYCLKHEVLGVPDPYYDGDRGFEVVLDIIEDACHELVKKHFNITKEK